MTAVRDYVCDWPDALRLADALAGTPYPEERLPNGVVLPGKPWLVCRSASVCGYGVGRGGNVLAQVRAVYQGEALSA